MLMPCTKVMMHTTISHATSAPSNRVLPESGQGRLGDSRSGFEERGGPCTAGTPIARPAAYRRPSAQLAMSDFPSMAHDHQVLTVPDVAGWARWLENHGEQSDGVWLVLAKKGTSKPTNLIYDDALAEAICHGWVDGQLASRDEKTFLRKFTPRRPRSRWSKRNVAIATKMIEAGRMRSSGLAAISSAQADGSWGAAYASQANMEVPPDLASALAAAPEAKTMFAKLSAANRYSILYRIATAKRSDTRQRRIEQLVAMLARGETIHPQR